MGRPVGGHTGTQGAVERHGGGPHQVGAHVVILWIGQRRRPLFDQGAQQAFGKAVLHLGLDRIGGVLLQGVHEGIDHAVGDLARRQRIGGHRIQNGEARLHERREEEELVLGRRFGDDGAVVHLGAGGCQGQHGSQRYRIADLAAIGLQNFPGIAFITCRGGNELAAVDHRATTHGQDIVDAFGLHHGDRLHQGLEMGVGLDATKLLITAAGQCGMHLIQNAILLDAATTIGDEHLGISRDLFGQLSDLPLAEMNAGRIEIGKVVHRMPLSSLRCR